MPPTRIGSPSRCSPQKGAVGHLRPWAAPRRRSTLHPRMIRPDSPIHWRTSSRRCKAEARAAHAALEVWVEPVELLEDPPCSASGMPSPWSRTAKRRRPSDALSSHRSRHRRQYLIALSTRFTRTRRSFSGRRRRAGNADGDASSSVQPAGSRGRVSVTNVLGELAGITTLSTIVRRLPDSSRLAHGTSFTIGQAGRTRGRSRRASCPGLGVEVVLP